MVSTMATTAVTPLVETTLETSVSMMLGGVEKRRE